MAVPDFCPDAQFCLESQAVNLSMAANSLKLDWLYHCTKMHIQMASSVRQLAIAHHDVTEIVNTVLCTLNQQGL